MQQIKNILNYKFKKTFLLFFFIYLFYPVRSEIITIDSLQHRIVLNSNIKLLSDTKGFFEVSDIASSQFDEIFNYDTDLTQTSNYHWIKLEIKNKLANHIHWHLHINPKQYNEVYRVTETSIVLMAKNGEYVRNSESAFPENPAVIPITLPKDQLARLYIRLNTKVHQEFKPFAQVELRLASTEMKSYKRNWIILAALVSVLLSLGFYMIFQFLLFRDKSFMYFFLAFFSLAFYFLAFERVGYALTNFDYFTRYTGNYLALFSTFFYIGFTRHFIDPEKRFKYWHNLLRRLQIFYFVPFSIIILINLRVFWNFTPYVHIMHVVVFIFLLTFAFKSYRNGHPLAGYYLWANAIFFVFLCLFVFYVVTKPTSETFSTYFLESSLKIGSFGQVLLFTLALASRFGQLNRAVVEKQLENERLEKEQILKIQSIITSINQDLENKVTARTAEISHQKEELKAQTENIESAYKEIAYQKNVIEKAHSQITDSLFYAAMIQEAVLPKPSLMSQCFKEKFILFWPRDIVSGDFYWATKIDDVILFAVGDCTGHGVPGAFMSMLGISLLNEIVKRDGITQPDIILNNLRINLINALQQESSGNEVRDGIEIALCALYKNNEDIENGCYTLDFAGSLNSCHVVINDNDCELPDDVRVIGKGKNGTLVLLKSDNFPISKHFKIEPFSKKTIKIRPGDMVYLTSDGITDQLGGPDYKKFSTNRFRNLLLNIHNLNTDQQLETLEKELLEWMNSPDPVTGSPSDQIDDFCVLGIRIN